MNRPLNRRALIGQTLLSAGLLAGAAACTAEKGPAEKGAAEKGPTEKGAAEKGPAFDPADWASVRSQFAMDPAYAQFAAFVLAPTPAPVREAIRTHRDALDADPEYTPRGDQPPDQTVREAAARYLAAAPGDIALTDSTTMGLGLVYSGIGLRPGQDVLTTEHDFLATHEALRLLAGRTGAKVRRVTLYDDPATATADRMVAAVKAGLGPRTRVVAVTWVHSSTGVRVPVRAIADLLAEVNKGRDERDRALLCVDGVHGFGAMAAGVADLGCDFLVSGAHKWLFGPRGTGIVWGRAWDAISPIIPSFSQASFDSWQNGRAPGASTAELVTPGGFKAFEHRWAMAQAFGFMTAIGKDRVQRRTQELASRLKAGLGEISHVTLATPRSPELSAGLVCCSITGMQPFEAVDRLHGQKVVASVTPYNPSLLRFGTSIVTGPEQVDQAIKAVAGLR